MNVDEIAVKVKAHHKILFGDIDNPAVTPGLVHEILTIKSYLEGNRRLHWIVIGLVISRFVYDLWPHK